MTAARQSATAANMLLGLMKYFGSELLVAWRAGNEGCTLHTPTTVTLLKPFRAGTSLTFNRNPRYLPDRNRLVASLKKVVRVLAPLLRCPT